MFATGDESRAPFPPWGTQMGRERVMSPLSRASGVYNWGVVGWGVGVRCVCNFENNNKHSNNESKSSKHKSWKQWWHVQKKQAEQSLSPLSPPHPSMCRRNSWRPRPRLCLPSPLARELLA